MANFGVGSAAQTLCESLKKRDKYVEVTAMRGFQAILDEAYKLDPRLTGCVVAWNGKQSGNGLFGVNKTFRLELTYADGTVNDIEKVILDDGKWKPSDTLSALPELPEVLQVVTSDVNDLRQRVDDDSLYIREDYYGLRNIQYRWNELSSNGLKCLWIHFEYSIEREKYKMYQTVAQREMERIDRQFFGKGSIPKIIKAYLVFSYLQQTCKYDQESADLIDVQQYDAMQRPWVVMPYGPLVKKIGVCEGISTAFKQFMDFYGIKNRLVIGGLERSSENHCWNMICINEKYYHVDVTYGLSGDGIYVGKFMKDDTSMSETHTWNMSRYPQCISRSLDFDYVEEYIHDHLDDLLRLGVEERYLCPDEIRE